MMQLINASELKLDEQYQTIYNNDNVKISKENKTENNLTEEIKIKSDSNKSNPKCSSIGFKVIKVLILSFYQLLRKNKLSIFLISLILFLFYRKKQNFIGYFKGILY